MASLFQVVSLHLSFWMEKRTHFLRAACLIPAGGLYGALRSNAAREKALPYYSSGVLPKCFSKAYLSRSLWKKSDYVAQVVKSLLSASSITLFALGLTNMPEFNNSMRNSIAWGTFTFGLPISYFFTKEIDARHTENNSRMSQLMHFEFVQFPLLLTYFFLVVTSFMKIGDESLEDYSVVQFSFVLFTWYMYAFIFSSTRANRESQIPSDLGLTHFVAQIFLAQQLLK